MRYFFLMVAIACACSAALLDDSSCVPSAAVGPMRKYHDAIAAADAERAGAIERARIELVAQLKTRQKAALEENDVDGATALAQLAKEYGVTKDRSAFNGKWTVHFPAGFYKGEQHVVRTYTIAGNKIVVEESGRGADPPTEFKVVDGVGFADFPVGPVNDLIESHRFTLMGKRLLVESFFRPHQFRDIPDQMGMAARH